LNLSRRAKRKKVKEKNGEEENSLNVRIMKRKKIVGVYRKGRGRK